MGKQISYMTLIGVHSTMHLIHPNLCHVTIMCVYTCVCTYVFTGMCARVYVHVCVM